MANKKNLSFVFLMVLLVVMSFSQAYAAGTCKADQDARMEWFRQGRFGMFIHWGLYSVLGGEWAGQDYGKEMGGASAEWIMHQADIPVEEYEKIAGDFNPVKFDAKEWVSLAKEAGMKYMVITAKHHDGFSMFDSKMTEYDIMDATPFKRDVVKELADECKRQGIRFGVYYSHSKDWRNRGYSKTEKPTDEYVTFVKGQLKELLTNYGEMSIIWFDMGDKFTKINSEYGEIVTDLQPDCLVSGRLGGGKGDSDYRQEKDRSIPAKKVTGDVESPMTFRDNWGYDKDEDNWKSNKDMLERMSLCFCRGANMLLNVGPKPDGTLCEEEIAGFKSVGKWMAVNSEAVYGTQASPFDYDFAWGSMTTKGRKLYLHVLEWNPEGIAFNGLVSKPAKAYLLADPKKTGLPVEHNAKEGMTVITVPAKGPDANVPVIVLEFDDTIEIDENATGQYHWVKDSGVRLIGEDKTAEQVREQSMKKRADESE